MLEIQLFDRNQKVAPEPQKCPVQNQMAHRCSCVLFLFFWEMFSLGRVTYLLVAHIKRINVRKKQCLFSLYFKTSYFCYPSEDGFISVLRPGSQLCWLEHPLGQPASQAADGRLSLWSSWTVCQGPSTGFSKIPHLTLPE